MYNLEVCVDTIEAAIAAEQGGATRLELCANLVIGGTTPSTSFLDIAKENVDIPIHVLFRPRFGDFHYSDFEFQELKRQIVDMKDHGADGAVIGMLNTDGSLDVERMKELIDLAGDMHIALHRAFDVCNDPYKALEDAKELGIQTILTSGQQQTALKGADLIKELIGKSEGKVDIMPGGGVDDKNVKEIANITQAKSYHASSTVEVDSPMTYRNPDVYMGLPVLSEYTCFKTDRTLLKNIKDTLDSLDI